MWEILVPTVSNDGVPFTHDEWKNQVREISGGLTALAPVNGEWVSPDGVLMQEVMVPVRVHCTKDEIMRIMNLTREIFSQEEVIAYRISNEVLFATNNSNEVVA